MSPYADLHVHSQVSDGTMTVEEIANAAIQNGVTLLAIADHNLLAGSRRLCEVPRPGLRCIPGVELDCLLDALHLHVLGYGVSLYDPDFCAFVAKARAALDGMSDRLAEKMGLSLEGFHAFQTDPQKGGWPFLQYLVAQGITKTLLEGIPFYPKYQVLYQDAGFPTLAQTIAAIHRAGGKAVIAHPGLEDRAFVMDKLERIAAQGIDGVECYYPYHSQEMTAACLAFCRERGLMITSGSDCHGDFVDNPPVGGLHIPVDQLALKGL